MQSSHAGPSSSVPGHSQHQLPTGAGSNEEGTGAGSKCEDTEVGGKGQGMDCF